MSEPLIPEGNGQTPLTHEEREELIPSYITTRNELNEAEQANILQAQNWAYKRKNKVLSIDYLNDLHKRMFGRVWKWAGKFRHSGKNNGNGRHARMAADLLLKSMDQPPFTWGSQNLTNPSETRTQYIQALQAADKHDYEKLFKFVRS